MRNLSLLPANEETRGRLLKMSGMYRMYVQIAINVEAVLPGHVLVTVIYEGKDLTDDDIKERVREIFDGELPEDLTLHVAVFRERPKKVKHVLAGDMVFRVDKGPYLVRIRPGGEDVVIRGQGYRFEVIEGELTPRLRIQLAKWLKSSVLRGILHLGC